MQLERQRFLPDDGLAGTLVARIWCPGAVPGPSVAAIRADGVFDLSAHFPTMSSLLDEADPAACVAAASGRRVCSLDELLANSVASVGPPLRDPARAHLLAPCDLQVLKAAGVTFATSLIERVIEEHAGGDASRAAAARAQVLAVVGDDLAAIVPGSPAAMALKQLLIDKGMWSQYLEVGIGPDAEVFTKAPVLSAVGTGEDIGILAASVWNNPEPEVVLAVSSRGEIVGATLGNDVNLRDFEGRSALLLGKAKDNNASCAIGPFIRLFDRHFGMADVRTCELALRVTGPEGFVMEGSSSLSLISRDPLDLVAQAIGDSHQYPDGFMLFLGTMFAPTQDRHGPGQGFTHVAGDIVTVATARLGTLANRVETSDRIVPWTYGARALMHDLARRGLLAR